MSRCIDENIKAILARQIDESVEKPSFGRWSRLECAIAIINLFVDERWESERYEFPAHQLETLKEQVELVRKAIIEGKVPEAKREMARLAVDNGEDVLKTSFTSNIT